MLESFLFLFSHLLFFSTHLLLFLSLSVFFWQGQLFNFFPQKTKQNLETSRDQSLDSDNKDMKIRLLENDNGHFTNKEITLFTSWQ